MADFYLNNFGFDSSGREDGIYNSDTGNLYDFICFLFEYEKEKIIIKTLVLFSIYDIYEF